MYLDAQTVFNEVNSFHHCLILLTVYDRHNIFCEHTSKSLFWSTYAFELWTSRYREWKALHKDNVPVPVKSMFHSVMNNICMNSSLS